MSQSNLSQFCDITNLWQECKHVNYFCNRMEGQGLLILFLLLYFWPFTFVPLHSEFYTFSILPFSNFQIHLLEKIKIFKKIQIFKILEYYKNSNFQKTSNFQQNSNIQILGNSKFLKKIKFQKDSKVQILSTWVQKAFGKPQFYLLLENQLNFSNHQYLHCLQSYSTKYKKWSYSEAFVNQQFFLNYPCLEKWFYIRYFGHYNFLAYIELMDSSWRIHRTLQIWAMTSSQGVTAVGRKKSYLFPSHLTWSNISNMEVGDRYILLLPRIASVSPFTKCSLWPKHSHSNPTDRNFLHLRSSYDKLVEREGKFTVFISWSNMTNMKVGKRYILLLPHKTGLTDKWIQAGWIPIEYFYHTISFMTYYQWLLEISMKPTISALKEAKW